MLAKSKKTQKEHKYECFCNICKCALEANSGTTPPCFL